MRFAKPDSSNQKNYKWMAFAAIAIGTFTSVSDFGSLVVILPSIAEYFVIDLPTSQWIVTGYALAIASLLLPMGRLSDIVGRKKIYVTGFAIFIVFAAVAGFSTSVEMLIASKVLQGIGAAMTQGTGMAMILSTFGGHERGKALGLQMSLVGSGNVVGPAFGGLIAGTLGWQSVFFANAIMGTLSLIPALLILDGRLYARRGTDSRFDWAGAALSTGALITFLLTLTNGSRLGWNSYPTSGGLLLLAILVTAFIWWERRTPNPLLDLSLFSNRLFTFGVSASFIAFIGQSSVRFLMPFYLQSVKGYSPSQVGLIIVPGAAAMIIFGPLSGRLSDKVGWRTLTTIGLGCCVFAQLMLSRLNLDSPLWMVIAGIVIQSAGMGIFNAPNNSSILSTVPESKFGVMSGFLNLVRNSANITGVVVITVIVTMVMASMGYPPSLSAVSEAGGEGVLQSFSSGLRVGYLSAGCLVILGIVLSLIKTERRPEPAIDTSPAKSTSPAGD